MTTIRLTVNGKSIEADVAPRTHLADFLREHLMLTGTHIGCEHGICGACTVEIDGEIARSCITYAVAADGADVRTIEGFDEDALMGRLRAAFKAEHALQCGYCTPGMLIAARDLVRRSGKLERPLIRTEMSGNLCRCTGYLGIVNAIERVMGQATPTPAAAPAPVADKAAWLGPAPGPDAAASPAPMAAALARSQAAPKPVADQRPAVPAAARRTIPMTLGALQSDGEYTTLTQTFVLEHPREAVWKVVADIERLAACLPGVVLDGPEQDGKVTGRAEVAMGPITARIGGEGTVERDAGAYRQTVHGQGRDRNSASRVKGRVGIALAEATPAGTRVEIAIAYAIAGPLAQFSRGSLVQDLVARIGKAFAQNLDASVGGTGGAPLPAAKLSAFGLMWGIIKARIARMLGAG